MAISDEDKNEIKLLFLEESLMVNEYVLAHIRKNQPASAFKEQAEYNCRLTSDVIAARYNRIVAAIN